MARESELLLITGNSMLSCASKSERSYFHSARISLFFSQSFAPRTRRYIQHQSDY